MGADEKKVEKKEAKQEKEDAPKEPSQPTEPKLPKQSKEPTVPEKGPKATPEPEAPKKEKKAAKTSKPSKEEKPLDIKLVEEMKEKKETSKKEEKDPLAGKMPPLFGKYNIESVKVNDPGLKRYINLHPIGQPHTSGRYSSREFGKHKMSIIERLINNMMRTEDFTGKKSKTYTVVKQSFAIIEKREKKNPVQVLVEALEHSAPREEVTRLRFGGISVPKAVDISPARRLDFALRNICKGAVSSTYKKKTPIQNCLANELIMASKGDMNSFAVQKKEEIERVAGSAR